MTPLIVDVISLQTWIPSIVQLVEERIHRQRQQLYILMTADLPSITTNVSALKQILIELLNHTCNYTTPGELITVSAQSTDDGMQISVSSSNMSPLAREQLQDLGSFQSASATIPHQCKDTGLVSAHKLAQQLRASLLLENTASQTTFTLQFPYETAADCQSNDHQDERVLLSSGAFTRIAT